MHIKPRTIIINNLIKEIDVIFSSIYNHAKVNLIFPLTIVFLNKISKTTLATFFSHPHSVKKNPPSARRLVSATPRLPHGLDRFSIISQSSSRRRDTGGNSNVVSVPLARFHSTSHSVQRTLTTIHYNKDRC